jgi:hypothetical protein
LDASDILENKVSQLQSLLSCCYGDCSEWFEGIGEQHRDKIMWIAADLATEAVRLSQEILKGTHANEPMGVAAHGDPHSRIAARAPGDSRARK